jgi:hypothetical protein
MRGPGTPVAFERVMRAAATIVLVTLGVGCAGPRAATSGGPLAAQTLPADTPADYSYDPDAPPAPRMRDLPPPLYFYK